MSGVSCRLLTTLFSTPKSKFLTIFQLEAINKKKSNKLASKCEWEIERGREHVWCELSSTEGIFLNS